MTITIRLEFDDREPRPDPDSVLGRVVTVGGRERPFSGWLQLLAALEDVARGGSVEADPDELPYADS